VSSLRELAGEVADNAHSAVLLLNDLLNYDKVRTRCAALYEQCPEFNDNSSMTRSLLQYYCTINTFYRVRLDRVEQTNFII